MSDTIVFDRKDHIEIWVCSNCGGANRWGNNTCHHCRTRYNSNSDVHSWICVKCREINPWSNNLCNNCGKHYQTDVKPYEK